MTAFGGTGLIFFAMATLSSVIKRDLSAMGKFLFVGVIMLMVAAIANIFLQSWALMLTISVIALGVFSAFMLYDIKRVMDGGETNYITATLGMYIGLYNVFSACWLFSASPAAVTERTAAVLRTGPSGPVFMSTRRCRPDVLDGSPVPFSREPNGRVLGDRPARTRRCFRHAPCAGTC